MLEECLFQGNVHTGEREASVIVDCTSDAVQDVTDRNGTLMVEVRDCTFSRSDMEHAVLVKGRAAHCTVRRCSLHADVTKGFTAVEEGQVTVVE